MRIKMTWKKSFMIENKVPNGMVVDTLRSYNQGWPVSFHGWDPVLIMGSQFSDHRVIINGDNHSCSYPSSTLMPSPSGLYISPVYQCWEENYSGSSAYTRNSMACPFILRSSYVNAAARPGYAYLLFTRSSPWSFPQQDVPPANGYSFPGNKNSVYHPLKIYGSCACIIAWPGSHHCGFAHFPSHFFTYNSGGDSSTTFWWRRWMLHSLSNKWTVLPKLSAVPVSRMPWTCHIFFNEYGAIAKWGLLADGPFIARPGPLLYPLRACLSPPPAEALMRIG